MSTHTPYHCYLVSIAPRLLFCSLLCLFVLSVRPCVVLLVWSLAVLILDWDDTVMCSSYLSKLGFKLDTTLYDLNRPLQDSDSTELKVSYEIAVQLRELAQCVAALLKAAFNVAQRVFII